MFDFFKGGGSSRVRGARSGIMSPIALAPLTCSRLRSRIWDFATAPCILEAINQRLAHGVLGYSRWKNDEFLGAIAHWFATRHHTTVDPQSIVYAPP
ncbi:protein MalY [Citrobacter koseri]|uniref:Protein MalY n=1 Tax=Citrobacter koseri TaxID=545 RepID=A0A2X2WFA5_CITKO|nr:protein MalY [Citrobacter koseri]